MLRVLRVSVLVLCAIISGANSQIKELDCPDFDGHFCPETPTYENRNILECNSDYVCGSRQKCCNNCKYGYKICTDLVVEEYLTNQDEYLKNKYCPKANSCITPLKYDPKYRCWSDEACPYGYKCCKSDCYIHKVCVVPIDKEGVEAVPPPPPPTTTISATEEETISSVVITSTKFPKTTAFLPTPRPGESSGFGNAYTDNDDDDSEEEGSGEEVTATKPSITTSSHQTTISSVVTAIDQETPTIIQETSPGLTEPTTSATEKIQTPQPTTISSPQTTVSSTITTIVQETSTKILEATEKSTESDGSGDGFTDDDEDDDSDEEGSGEGDTATKPSITSSSHQTTISSVVTTIVQETPTIIQETSPGLTERTTSTTEKIQTPRPTTTFLPQTTVSLTVTTSVQKTSTKIPEATEKSTKSDGSGDGFTDDDEDDDDGSGDDEKIETQPITTTSAFYTKITTVKEKETKNDNEITTKPSTTTTTRETTVSAETTRQKTSTKVLETTQRSSESDGSGDGFTDDDEDGDDGDYTGSGNDDKIETKPITTTTREETTKDDNVTTSNPSTTTTRRETTVSAETTHQKASTKVPETTQRSTESDGSGDGFTDDEDGDDTGSRDTTIKTQPTTTTMRGTTNHEEVLTNVPEITQTSTGSGVSEDKFTDDDDGREKKTTTSAINVNATTVSKLSTGITTLNESTTKRLGATPDSAESTINLEEQTTKAFETTPKSTDFTSSGNGFDNGSGDDKKVETHQPTTSSTVMTDLEFFENTTAFTERQETPSTNASIQLTTKPADDTEGSGFEGGFTDDEDIIEETTQFNLQETLDKIFGSDIFTTSLSLNSTTANFEDSNHFNGSTASESTVNQLSSSMVTTPSDLDFNSEENATTTYEEATPSAGLQNSTTIATEKQQSEDAASNTINPETPQPSPATTKPTFKVDLPNTPTTVNFDYENEITKNAIATTNDEDIKSSTPSPASIFSSTIQSLPSSLHTSSFINENDSKFSDKNNNFSTTPSIKETTNRTGFLESSDVPDIVDGGGNFDKEIDLKVDSNGTSASTDGNNQEKLGTIEAKETVDNSDPLISSQRSASNSSHLTNPIGKADFLKESSGYGPDDDSEEDDDSNGDDVDEDIRNNFNM